MSDPIAETKRPESWGCTLGIALGLALLAGLAAAVAMKRAAPVDGARVLAEWFDPAPVPAGFHLEDAVRLDDGRRLVRLASEALPVEPTERPAPENSSKERVDWARLAVGPAGELPAELLFVEYPLREASARLRELFAQQEPGEGRYEKLEQLDHDGGRVFLERDTLPWGRYSAVVVHERRFRAGPSFEDTLIVNLARGTIPLVLFATWPSGAPASEERLAQILAGLPSREVPDAPAD